MKPRHWPVAIESVKVVGVLPLSNEVMLLASAGIFILKAPRHPLAQQIRSIAQEVVV